MSLKPPTEPQKKQKKYCALCMGMVLYSANTNRPIQDTCDDCGMLTRVKLEPIEHEPVKKMLDSLRAEQGKKNHSVLKKIEDIFVMLSA